MSRVSEFRRKQRGRIKKQKVEICFLLKNLFQSIRRRETELYKEEMYVIVRNKDLFRGIGVKQS